MNLKLIVAFALAVSVAMMAQEAIAQDTARKDVAKRAAFETTNIVLYNNTSEFGDRAPPPAVIAAFIKQIQAEASECWIGKAPETGKSGLIAVAIRPDGTMKFWVDIDQKHQPEISAELDTKMQQAGVPQVSGGPLAFAINFRLWGGPAEPKKGVESVEFPQAWKLAAKNTEGPLKVPDDLLPLVWKTRPSEAENVNKKSFSPDGFVMQELRPVGGSILRPKDWIYTEQHRSNTLIWTISKENPKDGPYETGVGIQFIAGVKKRTGQSPSDFIKAFLDGKKKTSTVISECPKTKQGLFTRVCLETKELSADVKAPDQNGKATYRILYSCFWSDESDIAAISIAGTTPELWDTYGKVFDTMAKFELLDMDKIKSAGQ